MKTGFRGEKEAKVRGFKVHRCKVAKGAKGQSCKDVKLQRSKGLRFREVKV